MENQQIRDLIRSELPGLLQRDPAMREWVLELTRERYAEKEETQDRFDRLLEELRRDREAQTLRWEEEDRRWKESSEEDRRKWDEQAARWQEQDRKWQENAAQINRMLDSIEALVRKHDSTIGALGARWGLHTEQSFRNALRAILEGSFGVEVISVTEYDDRAEVFGRPDQVELDLIIKDGLLIVCEIKSSMSKADMHIFERKLRYYERKHDRQASRALVISPMVDARARELAQQLNLEVYSYAEDVPFEIAGASGGR